MNPCIKKMQYAVRGPLVIRATEIEKVRWLLNESFSSSSLHNWYQKNLRPTLLNCRDRPSVQVQAQLLRSQIHGIALQFGSLPLAAIAGLNI